MLTNGKPEMSKSRRPQAGVQILWDFLAWQVVVAFLFQPMPMVFRAVDGQEWVYTGVSRVKDKIAFTRIRENLTLKRPGSLAVDPSTGTKPFRIARTFRLCVYIIYTYIYIYIM